MLANQILEDKLQFFNVYKNLILRSYENENLEVIYAILNGLAGERSGILPNVFSEYPFGEQWNPLVGVTYESPGVPFIIRLGAGHLDSSAIMGIDLDWYTSQESGSDFYYFTGSSDEDDDDYNALSRFQFPYTRRPTSIRMPTMRECKSHIGETGVSSLARSYDRAWSMCSNIINLAKGRRRFQSFVDSLDELVDFLCEKVSYPSNYIPEDHMIRAIREGDYVHPSPQPAINWENYL